MGGIAGGRPVGGFRNTHGRRVHDWARLKRLFKMVPGEPVGHGGVLRYRYCPILAAGR